MRSGPKTHWAMIQTGIFSVSIGASVSSGAQEGGSGGEELGLAPLYSAMPCGSPCAWTPCRSGGLLIRKQNLCAIAATQLSHTTQMLGRPRLMAGVVRPRVPSLLRIDSYPRERRSGSTAVGASWPFRLLQRRFSSHQREAGGSEGGYTAAGAKAGGQQTLYTVFFVSPDEKMQLPCSYYVSPALDATCPAVRDED